LAFITVFQDTRRDIVDDGDWIEGDVLLGLDKDGWRVIGLYIGIAVLAEP